VEAKTKPVMSDDDDQPRGSGKQGRMREEPRRRLGVVVWSRLLRMSG